LIELAEKLTKKIKNKKISITSADDNTSGDLERIQELKQKPMSTENQKRPESVRGSRVKSPKQNATLTQGG